jgi:uncharacterized protein YbjT (DUF2867 family)
VVVDVTNAPSREDRAVLKFFETSTRNRLAHGAAAGVGRYVALSIVGSERLPESGYYRAKLAQENLIKKSSIPYSIVHATQFFEFVKQIAGHCTEGNNVLVPPALTQPMAADDVASALARIATNSPVNGTVEIGPQQFYGQTHPTGLGGVTGSREVISDPSAITGAVNERTLVPNNDARLGETRFEDWLNQSMKQASKTDRQRT